MTDNYSENLVGYGIGSVCPHGWIWDLWCLSPSLHDACGVLDKVLDRTGITNALK